MVNQSTEAIERGIGQGCLLRTFFQATGEYDEGTLINGERLNDIKVADTMESLQTFISHTTKISQYYGLDQTQRIHNRRTTNYKS